MSRLFTFGCSYTMWPWPTWADIIAHELKIPFQNWGLPGMGNVGISCRLLECDIRNNFTNDDIILVVWSSWTREDRFKVKTTVMPTWSCTGDVHNSYEQSFVDRYWSMNNDLLKNSTAIIQSNRLFNIRFNGHINIPLINDYDNPNLCFDEEELKLAKFYEPYIPDQGCFDPWTYDCRYTNLGESHPDVLGHLRYVTENIMPRLNLSMSNETIEYYTEMHNKLLDFTPTIDMNDSIDYRIKIQDYLLETYGWIQSDYYGHSMHE